MKRLQAMSWVASLICSVVLLLAGGEAAACTTVLVGKDATEDGAVLVGSSCDGHMMGHISRIAPARTYASGERIPMRSSCAAGMEWNVDETGHTLPFIEEIHRCILLGHWRDGAETEATGGMNEHGVTIGIEFIPMRPELDSTLGAVAPYTWHWSTSLIANGLRRATTAREAIELIGAMVEEYGFLYTLHADAGVALPIADGQEAWIMEIFGPEAGWTPESETPGGVWCAQRVPDDAVGVSANRSRIGEVDLENEDEFMASSHIHSMAERLGFWQEGEPFNWREVYADPGDRGNALREWRALSLVAPSLDLEDPVDPVAEAYPFSVTPEGPVTIKQLMAIMRDGHDGTAYDVTEHEAFQVDDGKSPLARPWGPGELFDLLDIEPERAIATPTSSYVFIAQLRDWLPPSIGNVLWFAPGPAYSSCFVPIYIGVNTLPDAWQGPADFGQINREQAQWNYRLVSNLVTNLNYQEAIADVLEVINAAEDVFLAQQAETDEMALRLLEEEGPERAEAMLTEYSERCLEQTGQGYHELVDYLMFQYLYDRPGIAPQSPPTIAAPRAPSSTDME